MSTAEVRNKRIAIDFDSTLVEETWPGMGDWLPGAVDALKYLASVYEEVVIYTLRVSPVDVDEVTLHDSFGQIVAIDETLDRAGIPDNVRVWTKPYKPPCVLIVDDKALRFNGDWGVTLEQIKYLDPTNHREEPMEAPMAADETVDEYVERLHTSDIRRYETGATRDSAEGKPSYASYLSPLVVRSYGEYMLQHETQSNGERREPGNWKRGMSKRDYLESLFRHFHDLWLIDEGYGEKARESVEEALNGIIFNASGYLHELLKVSSR